MLAGSTEPFLTSGVKIADFCSDGRGGPESFHRFSEPANVYRRGPEVVPGSALAGGVAGFRADRQLLQMCRLRPTRAVMRPRGKVNS